MAVHGPTIEKAKKEGTSVPAEVEGSIDQMRADYDRDLDARHAAARGQVDAIVAPEATRDTIAFLLRVSANYAGPHLGAFVLPSPADSANA